MGFRTRALALAFAAVWLAPAYAQPVIATLVPPDPATVKVPTLAFTPNSLDVRRYDEYFYFYKPGATYQTAFADLNLCRVYALSSQLIALPPKFVPLGADAPAIEHRPSGLAYSQYGVVGMMIAGVMIASAEEDNAIATNRRCMAYRGYGRFGTSRAIWKQIVDGSDTETMARQALIASGPQPLTEAIGQ